MNILVESQPLDVRSLEKNERDSLVISAVRVDDTWQVLSRYGDPIWEVRGAVTNRVVSTEKHDLGKIPEDFREQLKACMYRYLRRGRHGQKRPAARQFAAFFTHATKFLQFLERRKIKSLMAVSPMVCAVYVQECREKRGRSGKALSSVYLNAMFGAVEGLYELSQYTDDPMPFPWPDDTARNLAGLTGKMTKSGGLAGGRTPLIPDAVFSAIFQAAWKIVEQANFVLDVRDEVARLEVDPSLDRRHAWRARCALVDSIGWVGGVRSLTTSITDIRTACYIVVASLSGCRNHELAFVHSNSYYRTVDSDGEEYWWLRARSTKTGEGRTEWMIPTAAVEALRVMDRWAIPHQQELAIEVERRRRDDPADVEIAEAQLHVGAVFLGKDSKGQVRTLSDRSWNMRLKSFVSRRGIDWDITTHQFRRTFANYAARSQFGDLRYLKEHFKHWSLDMTLCYAMNGFQEVALYSEVYDELAGLKEDVVADWMGPIEPLAGGLGQGIMEWRGSNAITLFKDHKSMIRTLAEGFGQLRSNGHAWCTADQGVGCIGNGGLDRTRCTGCGHAVIGRVHVEVYQGLYDQLCETLRCDDIGEGGRAYIRRSLDRCASVLKALGCEPNTANV